MGKIGAVFAACKNIPPFNFVIDIIDEAPTQAEAESFLNTIGLMSALMLSVVAGKLMLLALFCHYIAVEHIKINLKHAFSFFFIRYPRFLFI